jgi:hypothetical protein
MSLSVSCDTGRIYPTDPVRQRPPPVPDPPREPVVDWIVENVVERVVVLLLRLDRPRPEALAKNVVFAAVTRIERACVLTIEVTHTVGEVRKRRLDDQVVVVAQQAERVESPPVAPAHALQDLEEDRPVVVVEEDRVVVVAFRADVVVRAGLELAKWSSHAGDRSRGERGQPSPCGFRRTLVTVSGLCQARAAAAPGVAETGLGARELGGDFGALEMLVRRAVVALGERRALARLPFARRRTAAGDPAVERTGLDLLLDEGHRGGDALLHRPRDLGLRRDREIPPDVLEQGSVRLREIERVTREALHRLLALLQHRAPVLEVKLGRHIRVDQVFNRPVDGS